MNNNQPIYALMACIIVLSIISSGCGTHENFGARSKNVAIKSSSTEKIVPGFDSVNWIMFDSRTLDHKFKITLNHPVSWKVQNDLNSDGRTFIPFYNQNSGVLVASILITAAPIGSKDIPIIDHSDKIVEKIQLNGHNAIRISGTIVASHGLEEILMPGKREIRVIVPDFEGNRFEFGMIVENADDEKVLNQVVKSIQIQSDKTPLDGD